MGRCAVMKTKSEDTGKPKLGVVFFAARWFEEVVLGNEGTAREF